jgi:hypothetical protein
MSMPRWLAVLIFLILLFAFVIPDPAAAGAWIGNAIDSLIIFFRSISAAVST